MAEVAILSISFTEVPGKMLEVATSVIAVFSGQVDTQCAL